MGLGFLIIKHCVSLLTLTKEGGLVYSASRLHTRLCINVVEM